jgi:hypothetical protein
MSRKPIPVEKSFAEWRKYPGYRAGGPDGGANVMFHAGEDARGPSAS